MTGPANDETPYGGPQPEPQRPLMPATPRGDLSDDGWRGRLARREAARHKLATQTWPQFFRGLALEIAVIAAIIAVVALVFWLLR